MGEILKCNRNDRYYQDRADRAFAENDTIVATRSRLKGDLCPGEGLLFTSSTDRGQHQSMACESIANQWIIIRVTCVAGEIVLRLQ